MSWRFRKSFKLLPGVRIHVSSRGVSTTIGGSPFSVHLGPAGAHANVSIPGTGVSFRERLAPRIADVPRAVTPFDPGTSDGRVEIRSSNTDVLASEVLAQFQRLLTEANGEQLKLEREIAAVAPDAAAKRARFDRWNGGLLLKYLMKDTFQRIGSDAADAAAHLSELHEQRRLASVATIIEVAEEQKRPFGDLCDAFSRLAACNRIWDTLSVQRTNTIRDRTIAARAVERHRVSFRLGGSSLLSCELEVPHLANANGGDLFLYPGFLLYQVSRQAFAVIDVRDLELTLRLTDFLEEEGVPGDAEVVGETWKKANKNGGPDRRFANNYRIPIVRYGELSLTSPGGLNERYLLSNRAASEQFVRAWKAYAATFQRRV